MATSNSLSYLFSRSLSSISKAYDLPTADQATQDLVKSSLSDLKTLQTQIAALSLFSPNETLEDISTRDLVYLLVPFVFAEVQERTRTTKRSERLTLLTQGQRHLRSFKSHLENYEVIPAEERELMRNGAASISDPTKRRDMKIKQFRKEKDIKARIEVLEKRRGKKAVREKDEATSIFDLIRGLLPSAQGTLPAQATSGGHRGGVPNDDSESDSETDDVLRETTLLLLRLSYVQACTNIENGEQELKLLQMAPPSPPLPPTHVLEDLERQKSKSKVDDDMWKLDKPVGKGPLLDKDGRPLQPFTILPAGSSDRARLQGQVFGPGHNLPTMSVDEYLQIEQERGNILSGGGAASQEAPTSSEQLAMDSEMDGTQFGDEKQEERRLKDERWAQYTDENPKGAGNTMNRG